MRAEKLNPLNPSAAHAEACPPATAAEVSQPVFPKVHHDPSDANVRARGQRPVSARKLAANRANAGRSTGPRSVAGKARSAMNAVRHGLAAAPASLLPGEDPDDLAQLDAEMQADLRPRGAAERELVARVVSLSWRLRRLTQAEEALWADAEDDRAGAHHRSTEL